MKSKIAYLSVLALLVLALILLVIVVVVQGSSEVSRVVETKVGSIRGLSASDGDYDMFMGIPYAYVDEENLFGNAVPYPEFEGIFDAFDDSAICPQIEDYNNTIVGTLDCLHINIYVPHSANPTNRLPVMVYIYGGYWQIGFAGRFVYGPKYLVRHDVIFIAFNYRLGPYGFMCLDIPEVPGNQGFKDQQLAMKWIKDNVDAFGGDPDKITLFGQSAGGMSVDFHLLSKEKPIFNKAIFQSGTSMNMQASGASTTSVPMVLAEELGFITNNVYEALSFLATVDSHTLIETSNKIGIPYGPCVEKPFDNVSSFLTELPINLDNPNIKDMPVMLGFTNQEMLSNIANLDSMNFEALESIFANTLSNRFDFDADELNKLQKIVRQFYIGDEPMSSEVIWELVDFWSDMSFVYTTEMSLKKFLENGAKKAYYYVMSHAGERNLAKIRLNITVGGAAHTDELGYLFDVSYMPQPNAEDQLVIDRMTLMWTNFAKYGDPTPETSDLVPVKWEPITKGSAYHYVDISSELKSGKKPIHSRIAFWDLFYKTHWNLLKGLKKD